MTRIIPVIAAAGPYPWLVAWLNVWATPILLDPNWNGGDYYGRTPPTAGLAQAIKIIALQANHYEWTDGTYGLAPARAGAEPGAALEHNAPWRPRSRTRRQPRAAAVADANHLLYLVKANQTFVPGAGAGRQDGRRRHARLHQGARAHLLCADGPGIPGKNGSRRRRAPAEWRCCRERRICRPQRPSERRGGDRRTARQDRGLPRAAYLAAEPLARRVARRRARRRTPLRGLRSRAAAPSRSAISAMPPAVSPGGARARAPRRPRPARPTPRCRFRVRICPRALAAARRRPGPRQRHSARRWRSRTACRRRRSR